MTKEELVNVLQYIIWKCDILINNKDYIADAFVQCNVEDIAEMCHQILDGDYGKILEQ